MLATPSAAAMGPATASSSAVEITESTSPNASAAVGDINADGAEDVLIGAPAADEAASGGGGAYVFFGGCWMKNYCLSTPNSSGERARLRVDGSNSITTNNMRFAAHDLPGRQFGIVFYGLTQIQVPMGNGYLCVGGGGLGLFRLRPVVSINAEGDASLQVDLNRPPSDTGNGAITPGSTWNFQFWFRDPMATGSTTNLTDGVEIEFCP